MFRRNHRHKQQELFNSFSWMNERTQELLMNSWAPAFYEHVFCQIDETPFAVLYCPDNGRPNFPVNVLLSLEFIKHLKGYSDEELIEQFHFNYQIMFAVGIRDLGSLPLAPRTLYEFRERIYNYTLEHPEESSLIFEQFQELTKHFCDLTNASCEEQRMDSTQIMPNIKRAGRLSLGYDVLVTAVKSLPQDILPDALAEVLNPDFKTELLYRAKANETRTRLQEVVKLCAQVLDTASERPELYESEPVLLVKRFLSEQANFDDKRNEWRPKKKEDIPSGSLQSAFDPDATYRSKGNKDYVGYVLNLAETCADENPVQFITDYTLKPNSIADTDMLRERMLPIKATYSELDDLYVDGGYYGGEIVQQADTLGIELHYTNMTGRATEKLPVTRFQTAQIDGKPQVTCPAGQEAFPAYFGEGDTLVAHFDRSTCKECTLRADCPATEQQTSTVVRITPKSRIAAKTRQKLENEQERRETTSARAAIEATNSALKRAHGAAKLAVRTINKSRIATGFKVIGRNIRQMLRWAKGEYRRTRDNPTQPPSRGVGVPAYG